jgi:Tol biopolymer transport system component
MAVAGKAEGLLSLYVVEADGTGLRRVTTGTDEERDPAWAPDGKRLAFAVRSAGGWGIATVRLDGGGLTRVTEGGNDRGPAWSPDGERLAFCRVTGANQDVWAVSASGGEPVRLTDGACADAAPAWSPDGKQIAFATDREGTWRIYLMAPDGSGQERTVDAVAQAPAWSPDGKTLAYAGTPDPRSARGPLPVSICLMAVRGHDPDSRQQESAQVPESPRRPAAGVRGQAPDWSPDGKRIAFTRDYRVYVMRVEGGEAEEVG